MSWNAQGNNWSQQGANSWPQQQAGGNAGWGQQQQQASQGGNNSWQQPAQASQQQGGQQQWGATAQQGNNWGQQQTAQQAAAAAPKNLTVQGCQHPTIGGIVKGSFTVVSENHSKPVFKKDSQVSGLDVMIYYWDERDGPSQAGWWFGPKVGGEQVWAYHPETKTPGPPKQGWQVPYGGPVDATFIVEAPQPQQAQPQSQQQQSWGNNQAQAQSWGNQQAQQSQQQQAWGNNQAQGQQSWGGQQAQQSQAPAQQQQSWGNNQAQAQQSWGNQQGQQSQAPAQQQQSWGNQAQAQQSWGNQQAQGNQQAWGNQQSQQSQGNQQAWGNQAQGKGQQAWGNQQSQQSQGNQQSWGNQAQGKGQQAWGQQDAQQAKGQAKGQAWGEQWKKLEEAQAMKKKMEEERNKKLEEQQKKMEELRLKREAEEKKRNAQRAKFSIQRAIQKVKTASIEAFDTLEGELHAEVDKEMPNCPEFADALKEEIEKGLEEGRARVEKLKEAKKLADELKAKAEAERKEKELKAKSLVDELDGLMTAAEEKVKSLQETIKSSEIESPDNSPEQVKEVSKITDEAEEAARAASKICFEFMRGNGAAIKAPEADEETKGALPKMMVRMSELQKGIEAASGQLKTAKAKAEKTLAAKAKTKDIEDTLKKYDKDKDGLLSEKEVIAYAKGEFNVNLSKDLLSFAMMSLVEADSKGIKASALPRLKSIVGISRELARDKKRLDFRIEKERVIGGMKDALKAKVQHAASFVTAADKAVKEAESEIASIHSRAKIMSPDEMISLATKSDKAHEVAKAKYQKAPNELEKAMKSIDPKYEKDLKEYIHKEAAKLESDLKRMEMRLNRVSVKSERYRTQAMRKELDDLLALRAKALKVIQYNQSVKKISRDDLFALFDNGSGSIGESEFLAFFDTADMEIRHLTMGEEKAEEEEAKGDATAEGDAKTDEATAGEEKIEKTEGDESKADEETAEGKEQTKEDEEKEEKVKDETLIETVELSKEELARVFTFLSDTATSCISKEDFIPFVTKHMKVVKETVMTENAEIGTGKPGRKLEAGEVVEIIEGPIKDIATKCTRARCKAVKDDLEGWVSIVGNQGSVFLEEKVGGLYKVLKKSIITDSFELNGEADSDESKILKVGSILEVREEPKKDEVSGLTRMKGRVRSQDHLVGWVTTKDKAGKVFVSPY